jgi:hypothetical protein
VEADELSLTHSSSHLSSVWDLESGKCTSILTRDAAEQQEQAAKAWRDARSSGCTWAPSLKDGAVDVVVDGASLATVYLMPPTQLNVGTLRVTNTRLAAFTTDNLFVLYELNVQGEPAAMLAR